MRYRIVHETVLEYPSPVREHHVELRMTPRECAYQRLLSRTVETVPAAAVRGYTDSFGNRVDCFCVIPPHERLVTRVAFEVENTLENPFAFLPPLPSEQPTLLRAAVADEPRILDYVLHESALTPGAARLAALLGEAPPAWPSGTDLVEALMPLMEWTASRLEYRSGATPVHAPLADAIASGAGVCQDYAHLFLSVVRSWGVPARYVMGYLGGDLLPGQGSATHAWAEVLVPRGGWIGFDAANRLLANDRYVPAAVGRDSYDAAPQRGSFKGGDPGATPAVRVEVSEQ